MVRIGIVARRLGVSTETLRRYERREIIKSSGRSLAGHRFFSEDDIVRIEGILFRGNRKLKVRDTK